MKKLFFGIFMLTILTTTAFGQKEMKAEKMEKIKAYRVKFFTKNLELTEQEANEFWLIYNEYQGKKEAIRKAGKKRQKVELMNDDEVESYLIAHLNNEQKLLDAKKDFFRQVKSVLPIRKVAMIPRAEKQFRKEIVAEMRQRRENRGR
ncbi:MAG: hypothetical protein ACI9XO_003854 [Paraglaciecola sp.]|jgi:hypothetical protein